MKSLNKFFLLIVVFSTFSIIIPKKAEAQGGVSFQIFYDNLSPYGQWVDYPSYGYVWIPMAGPDFFPYSSNGHWIMTDYGWTWVSDYNWGWAPFHYGRWSYDDYYGWFWIPNDEWGPAWVVWRTSPDYYGWAPLGPNISINIVINNGYNPPPDHWVFLPDHYMGRNDINSYYGPRKNNQEYINNSTVISNTYVDNSTHNTYITGPRKEDVQKVTGKPIETVAIKENSKPGQTLKNNQLILYRPTVSPAIKKDARPAKIADKKDVKPISERSIAKPKGNVVPINKGVNKEPLQRNKEIPKSNQENKQQKQNVPDNKEKRMPVQKEKRPVVTPQPEKINPKAGQNNNPPNQNAPNIQNEKPIPVQKEKQPPLPQQRIAPQRVPAQPNNQGRQKEQHINAPTQPRQQNYPSPTKPTNAPSVIPQKAVPPAEPLPRNEKK